MSFGKDMDYSTWGERLFSPSRVRRTKSIKYRLIGSKNASSGLKRWSTSNSSSGKKKQLKERLKRVAKNTSEVMVKITGSDHSTQMLKKHIDYISRNGDVSLMTEQQEQIKGRVSKKELHERWGYELTDKGKNKYAESYHIVFSMPPNTPRIEFREAAEETIKKLFANHQYYYAEHQDTEHPHMHVVVKALNIEGKRLSTKKADLHRWRQQFAKILREHGIQAEATKRIQRGKILQNDSSKLHHLKKRGQEPRLNQEQRQEQYNRVKQGIDYEDSPAVKKARKTRYAVMSIYSSIIKDLDKSSQPEDKKLVNELKQYLNNMKHEKPERQNYYNLAKAELEKANKIKNKLHEQQRIIIQEKDKSKDKER